MSRPALRPSERAVLHLLRLNGAMSKADLARLSAMSAQGVSVIVDRLLDLDLVLKQPKQRGKVGQPSTPITLNPDGALAMGIFAGRRGGEIVLSDFAGDVRQSVTVEYDDASDPATQALFHRTALEMAMKVEPDMWKRHVGTCIAAGEAVIGHYRGGAMERAGTHRPLAATLAEAFGAPVHCINDIRAACLAEMTLGGAGSRANMLYFSVGQWFGSGIVLEGRLIGDETCLSSGIHALPVQTGEGDGGVVGDYASLFALISMLRQAGHDPCAQIRFSFPDSREIFDAWRARAVETLAFAIRSACATVPLDSVLIDSGLEAPDLETLIDEVRAAVAGHGRTAKIERGSFGSRARAMGTAMVPFFKVFGPVDERETSASVRRAVA